MLDREARVRRSDDVVFRELASGDGGVLLHLETGQYHGLNRIGSLIWSLLDGERPLGAVVAEVRARLEDSPPTLDGDVARFLESMRSRDLVR